MKNVKNHMQWAWIIIVSFFVLGIMDIRFGILGILCMAAPLIHALRGKGKIHCVKYCPRGSFLGKFLGFVSRQVTLPKFMTTTGFRNGMLIFMLSMFSIAMIKAGGDFNAMAKAFYRFMGMSFIVGILMGIVFKPRSWCTVCPMGHATHLIKTIQSKK